MDSTIYTIGTALNRAHDNNVPVQLLVEGHWIGGHVVAVDGHGVVLTSEELEHTVIRMQSVAAVRVYSELPGRTPIGSSAQPVPAWASFAV